MNVCDIFLIKGFFFFLYFFPTTKSLFHAFTAGVRPMLGKQPTTRLGRGTQVTVGHLYLYVFSNLNLAQDMRGFFADA